MRKLLTLMLATASVAVFAANDTGSGAYISLNTGLVTTQQFYGSNAGVALEAGYAFNKYLAVEGDYAYLGGENATGSFSGISVSDTGTTSFLTANVRGTLPLTNMFSLYGKLGAGLNYATISSSASAGGISVSQSYSSTNAAGLIAVGAEFNLTQRWGLKVEDVYYLTRSDATSTSSFGFGNSNFFNIGAEFRF